MSESEARLRASFPGSDWLGAEQVAAGLEWARSRICQLCAAREFPLVVEVREGRVQISLHDFARHIDGDTPTPKLGAGPAAGSLVLVRLFQAELRAEIYRLELNRSVEALMRFVDQLAIDPQDVDQRCLFQLEMAKTVLKTQARALATGLLDVLESTASPERPLASEDSSESV